MNEAPAARSRAVRRIKRRRRLRGYAIVFLVINGGLWILWAANGAETDNLWPAWVTGIWLVVLILVYVVYGERRIPERQIEAEMRRIDDS